MSSETERQQSDPDRIASTTDVDNTSDQLVYTLDTAPANGTLYNNGVALSAGGSFTQADIDAGLITYDHDGSQTSSDAFAFTVDDGAGATTSRCSTSRWPSSPASGFTSGTSR